MQNCLLKNLCLLINKVPSCGLVCLLKWKMISLFLEIYSRQLKIKWRYSWQTGRYSIKRHGKMILCSLHFFRTLMGKCWTSGVLPLGRKNMLFYSSFYDLAKQNPLPKKSSSKTARTNQICFLKLETAQIQRSKSLLKETITLCNPTWDLLILVIYLDPGFHLSQ